MALILDIAATIFVFLMSIVFNNTSFYDPYWGVAPIFVILFWVFGQPGSEVNTVRQYMILALVLIWSIRLTANWIRRWKGLYEEDWRYADFRDRSKFLYWLTSFTGFHLFPTLIVFLGCFSIYPALNISSEPVNIIDLIACMITLTAIIIEATSDQQLWKYLRSKKEEAFLTKGLWKYSRHPNYFGEVLFWSGLFIFTIAAKEYYWWIPAGPVAMILLFNFISVPMMDRRMSRKEGYREYMKKTSGWVLWFRR